MKVLDVEGVAIHNGPESCAAVGNRRREALTGGDAGQPWRRETRLLRGTDPLVNRGRPYRAGRFRESGTDPARSKTLCMRPRTSYGNREVLRLARVSDGTLVRVGKLRGSARR